MDICLVDAPLIRWVRVWNGAGPFIMVGDLFDALHAYMQGATSWDEWKATPLKEKLVLATALQNRTGYLMPILPAEADIENDESSLRPRARTANFQYEKELNAYVTRNARPGQTLVKTVDCLGELSYFWGFILLGQNTFGLRTMKWHRR